MSYTAENKKYVCYLCQEKYKEYQKECPSCYGSFSVVSLPNGMSFDKKKTAKTAKKASEILKDEKTVRGIEGFEFLGLMPEKFNAIFFGKPGSGKSYLSLLLSDQIAKESKNKTVYITGEEDFEDRGFKKKLIDCKTSDNLIIECIEEKKELYEILEKYGKNANFFIDSISELELKKTEIKKITKWSEAILIMISHANKSGQLSGSNKIKHLTQMVVKVEKGIAKTEKNRLDYTQEEFNIFERISNG